MFWIGLFIGVALGILAMGYLRSSSHDDDCKSCKAYYVGVIRGLEDQIHGLKSTKGKLASELNSMAFRNSGYKAR